MDDIRKIKKQVAVYGFLVIAVCEAVSFFVIGFDLSFSIFLLIGFAAAIINFNLIAFFLNLMLKSGNQGFSAISFAVRMVIYCAVFFFAARTGFAQGVAALLGVLAPKVPLYYFHSIKPDFNTERKVSPEVQAMYEAEDREKEGLYDEDEKED